MPYLLFSFSTPTNPGQLHLKAFALAVPWSRTTPPCPHRYNCLAKSLTSFTLWLQVPLLRRHTPTTLFKIVTHSLFPTLPLALRYFHPQHLSPSNTHVRCLSSAPSARRQVLRGQDLCPWFTDLTQVLPAGPDTV